ncbi:MAG: glycerate 2-kinase [Bacteroidia bacterium]|jgi:glycerate 2-kinase
MSVGPDQPEAFLRALFNSAVEAANPHATLRSHLPTDTSRSAVVIGAGKASAAMAATLEKHWQGPLSGVVVTPYGHTQDCQHIEVVEAAHPVPDGQSEKTGRRILNTVSGLDEDQLVICLISGGGSSLLALPAPGISLSDKRAINKSLLRSGAAIDEINCVRKHLSLIKGGRLARAAMPAQLCTYAISDVPGDDPCVIASGPTVPDPSTTRQALEVLAKYRIETPASVAAWLASKEAETLKADHPAFQHSSFHMIGTPTQSIHCAAQAAEHAGIDVKSLGANIEGEAREVAAEHAAMALAVKADAMRSGRPVLILSGGETTVTVRGNGRGGRNSEYALALALALSGTSGIYGLAADTDGIDGSENNAGAFVSPDSLARAQSFGLDPMAMLDNNDGYSFFSALDDLLVTGPTRTNVNDFRAILVLP